MVNAELADGPVRDCGPTWPADFADGPADDSRDHSADEAGLHPFATHWSAAGFCLCINEF